ncbi:unnamed protein product [Calypogeia fissa]
MPCTSDRQKALHFVKEKLELSAMLESSSSDDDSEMSKSESNDDLKHTDSDSDLEWLLTSDSDVGGDPFELEANPDELSELYFVMDATRYFVERPLTSKLKDFVENFFLHLPQRLFRQVTWIDKPSFFELLNRVENHPIYHNRSTNTQAPIIWQLAVTLDRLGHDGNGACLNHLIPTWGVSNGSLCNFTKRTLIALDSALHGVIRWADRAERRRISEEFAKKGFSGCVGLIDGTLIPLTQRPKNSGECYYDRKCNYSMNAQVICDHQRKILFLYTGMPGSVSDLTAFKRTSLYADMNEGSCLIATSTFWGTQAMCQCHTWSVLTRGLIFQKRERC